MSLNRGKHNGGVKDLQIVEAAYIRNSKGNEVTAYCREYSYLELVGDFYLKDAMCGLLWEHKGYFWTSRSSALINIDCLF